MKDKSTSHKLSRVLWTALCVAATLTLAGLVAHAADASPPALLSYQGYLTDANGNALGKPDPRNYDVVFRIYDASQAGNTKWAEQQTITVDNGYFTVMLGQGSAVSGEPRPSLATVFSGSDISDRYIGITVNELSSSEIAPRLRLLTSPYAFLAKNALNITSEAGSVILNAANGSVGIKKDNPSTELEVNGTAKATAFVGDGSGLTAINGANLSSGTIADARLSSNIPRLNTANSFSANNTFGGDVTVSSDKKMQVGGAVYARGGTPGANNANNNGFAFSGGSGDNDSGLFSTADGRVSLYVNNAEKVRATSSGAEVTGTLNVSSTATANAFSGFGTIPLGGIIMWSGAIADIPNGWALCDGGTYEGRQTPNLKNRFIVGAGDEYAVKATGGSKEVALSEANLPSHRHGFHDYYFAEASSQGASYYEYWGNNKVGSGDTDSDNRYIFYVDNNTSYTGSGTAHENRPPYLALAFIMRVK